MNHKNAHRVIRVGLGPGPTGIRQISVDLHVFWPHDVDHPSAVLQVLDTAYQEVRGEIQQSFATAQQAQTEPAAPDHQSLSEPEGETDDGQ